MEEIVIVAGGINTRLDGVKRGPKTLTNVNGHTILDRIIATIARATDNKFRVLIAAGFFYDEIQEYVNSSDWTEGEVDVVEATHWKEGNAATLIAARELIGNDNFVLQMSDHLFDGRTYMRCISQDTVPVPHVCGQPTSDGIPAYLDLDDATKILADDTFRIDKIGKNILEWNMIDMGVFRLSREAFRIIEELPTNRKSLSNYVAEWKKDKPFYVSSQPGAVWKDIDTHVDLDWAIKMAINGRWDPA